MATRDLVKKAAAGMGYEVDANLTKLMGYLRRCRQERALCNLAWINCSDRGNYWQTVPWDSALFFGARQRASEMGYALDEIWIREPGFKLSSISKILRSRGIEGLLLSPPLWEVSIEEHIPWDDIHAVVLYEPNLFPRLHRVDFNASYNLQLALAEVIKLGYRRPGLMISRHFDYRYNYALSGQFLTEQIHLLERAMLSPFWTERWEAGPWKDEDFMAWFKRERPDVLFVANNEVLPRLESMGIRVPQDVGLIHLNWAADVKDWAAIDLQRELAGSSAVDLLTAHIARGEKRVFRRLPKRCKSAVFGGRAKRSFNNPSFDELRGEHRRLHLWR